MTTVDLKYATNLFYSKYSEVGSTIKLIEPVINWLQNYNISYIVNTEEEVIYIHIDVHLSERHTFKYPTIVFANEEDAILFKLTWM
jgi:hypothetical protein